MIGRAPQEHPALPVRQLCALFGVGRTWYYTHPTEEDRAGRDTALRAAIARLVLAFPGSGYRRVTKALQRDGWAVNHKRVLRVMRQESLLCQLKRHWGVTTDSRHGERRYPNLAQELVLGRPNQVWVADSTLSACRPRSSSWRPSATRSRAAASAGSCRAPSTRTSPWPLWSRRSGSAGHHQG